MRISGLCKAEMSAFMDDRGAMERNSIVERIKAKMQTQRLDDTQEMPLESFTWNDKTMLLRERRQF
jgi:hypothetical protein